MSDTLAQLTDKLQTLLMANRTIFDDHVCASAIRQTLQALNQVIPLNAAVTVDAVSSQYEYELDDPKADLIVDVLRQGLDAFADENISLNFDAYFEDDRPYFRLHCPQSTGTTLIVRYTKPHTISGLDSETDSTLTHAQEITLIYGAAYRACLQRPANS